MGLIWPRWPLGDNCCHLLLSSRARGAPSRPRAKGGRTMPQARSLLTLTYGRGQCGSLFLGRYSVSVLSAGGAEAKAEEMGPADRGDLSSASPGPRGGRGGRGCGGAKGDSHPSFLPFIMRHGGHLLPSTAHLCAPAAGAPSPLPCTGLSLSSLRSAAGKQQRAACNLSSFCFQAFYYLTCTHGGGNRCPARAKTGWACGGAGRGAEGLGQDLLRPEDSAC